MTARSILADQDHSEEAGPFQTTSRPLRDFRLGGLLQYLVRGPASLGGAAKRVRWQEVFP